MQNNETKVNNILESALHSLSYDEIKELIYNLQERLPKEAPKETNIKIPFHITDEMLIELGKQKLKELQLANKFNLENISPLNFIK
jgi:hypothetical protein